MAPSSGCWSLIKIHLDSECWKALTNRRSFVTLTSKSLKCSSDGAPVVLCPLLNIEDYSNLITVILSLPFLMLPALLTRSLDIFKWKQFPPSHLCLKDLFQKQNKPEDKRTAASVNEVAPRPCKCLWYGNLDALLCRGR